MEEPNFDHLEAIEEDLKKFEATWGLFDEFSRNIEDFAVEEWIVFRSKTFRFEEFLNNWSKA